MDTTQFPAPKSMASFLTRVLLGILFFIQGFAVTILAYLSRRIRCDHIPEFINEF